MNPFKAIYFEAIENWLRRSQHHYRNPEDLVTFLPPGGQCIGTETVRRIRKIGSEHGIEEYRALLPDSDFDVDGYLQPVFD